MFNATSTARFLKGNPFNITRIERELTGHKLKNELLHETGQEVLEEGISNVWEKAGEASGKGKSVKDYFYNNGNIFSSDAAKELVSKDTFENVERAIYSGCTYPMTRRDEVMSCARNTCTSWSESKTRNGTRSASMIRATGTSPWP